MSQPAPRHALPPLPPLPPLPTPVPAPAVRTGSSDHERDEAGGGSLRMRDARKPTDKDARFEELMRSDDTLRIKLGAAPAVVRPAVRSKSAEQLGEPSAPAAASSSTPKSRFALFSRPEKPSAPLPAPPPADAPASRSKADLFEDIIKSDKTVKLSLRANAPATAGTGSKGAAATPEGDLPLPRAQASELAATAGESVRARKERPRSRTISDIRTVNQMLSVNSMAEQVIRWLETVLMEPLAETDLIDCIQTGDVLVRLALLIRPEVQCKFAAKGDAFAMQKIAFFLECCEQIGVPKKQLFNVSDVKGANMVPIVQTFSSLTALLQQRGWSSPSLPAPAAATQDSGNVTAAAAEGAAAEPAPSDVASEESESSQRERTNRLSRKLLRLSMTPAQLQTLVVETGEITVAFATAATPATAVVRPAVRAVPKQLLPQTPSTPSPPDSRPDSTEGSMLGARLAAYNELIATERSYINDLRLVVQYLDVMRRKQMISRETIQLVFSNVEELLSIHQILLSSLEARPQRIGETFSRMYDFLKVYNIYCANFPSATAFLNRMRDSDPLKIYLRTFTALDDSGGLPIETFLMKPVQRICRYPMLLKRLGELTPLDAPDKLELPLALAKVEAVVNTVNESRRQKENSERILQLQAQLTNGSDKVQLLSPARRFIMDGAVWKIFPGDKLKDRHLFLFNDLLILATPQGKKRDRFNIKFSVDLADVAVLEDPDEPLFQPGAGSEEDEARRAQIAAAIHQFNADKPAKAVAALLDQGLVERSAEGVAAFLMRTPELSRVGVGEYLGGPAAFQRETLKAYLAMLDMAGLRFDEALRIFLATFRLPGEAQIIDRMMESFSVRYCEANLGAIPGGADMAHTLVFALIMLNTSLHNPNVDRKMTLDDFVRNFRNADEAAVVPDALLHALYRSIRDEKLEMGLEEDTGERLTITLAKVPQRLCLGVPSLAVVVTLPAPHPTVRLKLSGQGLQCDPAVLSFTESATASFVVTGLALGRKTLLVTRVGKGARQYSKPPPIDLVVQLPMLQHTLMMEVTHRTPRESTKEVVRLGVPTREERLEWHTTLARAVDERQRQVQNRTTRPGAA